MNKIKWVLPLLAVLWTLSFVFWGRGGSDPYYWISIYKGILGDGISISFLTVSLGHFLGETFGYSLLTYRLAGCICDLLSILVPYLFIVPEDERFSLKGLLFLSLTLILMGYGTFNEFSPGTLSFMLLSFSLVPLYRFSKEGNLRDVLFLSVLTALAVSARFPNILACGVIGLFLIVVSPGMRKLTNALIYAVSTFAVFFILFVLLTGKTDILRYYSEGLSVAGSDPGHTMHSMIQGLFLGANEILIYLGIYELMMCGVKIRVAKRWKELILTFVLVLAFCYFLKQNIGTHIWYNMHLVIFLATGCLFLCGYQIAVNSNDSRFNVFLAASVLVLTVIPAGSDTAWMKLFPSYLVLLPIVLLKINPDLGSRNLSLAIVTVLYSSVCFANNNISHGDRENVFHQKAIVEHPVMKGTLVSRSDKDYIDEMLSDYQTFGHPDSVIFYGTKAHMPYCLSGTIPMYEYGFWMHATDSLQLVQVFDVMKTTGATLFYMEPITIPFFDRSLDSLGYAPVKTTQYYTVFRPHRALEHSGLQ